MRNSGWARSHQCSRRVKSSAACNTEDIMFPRNPSLNPFLFLNFFLLLFLLDSGNASFMFKPLVPKEERSRLALTDYGEISAVDVDDGYRGTYCIQFITMEPNSLFLPVLLQEDLIFYVQTGRGRVEWVVGDEEKASEVKLQRGDIYTLRSGSVFYMQSYPDATTREKLRIHALFTKTDIQDPQATPFGPYSSLSDLVLGFEKEVLQMAFRASAELMEGMITATKPPSIIHMPSRNKTNSLEWKGHVTEIPVGDGSQDLYNGHSKKRMKPFNLPRRKPDVQNCNGQSLAVTAKDFHPLKDSDIGIFMVNLTKGSMMAPHWNPRATEIAIVLHGQGMIRIVCSSNASQCQNSRFRVKVGDVFVVPRFHPMVQISFNNDSLIFVGFSTRARRNRPQFLAGTRSVLQTMDPGILAMSFNVTNATMKQLLIPRKDFIFLECTSCAEEEEKRMREEERQQKQEEEKKRKEEEEKKRKEKEEARKKREEEEKERKEKEEAMKKREEEEKKRKEKEEARKKREEEEEARKKREEEEEARKKREEEEEARKKREEEDEEGARRKREEEERRKTEEAAARRKREEETRKKREEEEEARRKREEEEEARRKREEEEAARRKREEEKEPRRKREEEERKRKEEEKRERQKGEEAGRKKEETARSREEEEEEDARRQAQRKREREQRGKAQVIGRRSKKEEGSGGEGIEDT